MLCSKVAPNFLIEYLTELTSMTGSIKLGLLQMDAGPDKHDNLERIETGLSEIDGEPDIVVTPEYMMGMEDGKVTKDLVRDNSEPIDGRYVSTAKDMAKEHGVALLTTAYVRDGKNVYNTSIFTDEEGEIAGAYRKMHLFDAFGYKESDLFSRGDEVTVIDWRDIKIGLATCFDVRFPELFRILNFRGADLVLVPSGFYEGEHKGDQWKALINARAHENNFFVAGVNHPEPHFVGESIVSSPLGYEVTLLGEDEEFRTVEIDLDEIEESEKRMPINKLTRPDLYKRFSPYDGE